MTRHLKILILMLAACAVFQYGTANAAVRAKEVCPALNMFAPGTQLASTSHVVDRGRCYSNHTCFVGVRGDWLDTTNPREIVRVSGPAARITFVEKGTERSTHGCIPGAGADREGFIKIKLEAISGTGTLRIRLPRPGGSDTIDVNVRDGSTYLMKTAHTGMRPGETAERGFSGKNLDKLRIKRSPSGPQPNSQFPTSAPISAAQTGSPMAALRQPDAILSQTEVSARIRLTYNAAGTFSLDDKLEFEGGVPPLNRDFGWPSMRVAGPPPPPAAKPPAAPRTPPAAPPSSAPSTGTSGRPNLTPGVVFPTRPMIRKINRLQSIMIPAVFCTGLANNETREVAVPDFEWSVANDRGAAVGTPFSNVVVNAANNATLSTQQVTSIPRSDIRTFRNWPGRPSRIRVIKVTGALTSEYQNTAGCYIPNALAGSVVLDPATLIVRVDSAGQIGESRENDNDVRH